MPTNLALDPELIDEAQRIGKHRTKREAVNAALREYIQRRRQLGLVELFGTIEFDKKYNYKRERSRSRS
jgi:Arc/MetJ family transcription regulator